MENLEALSQSVISGDVNRVRIQAQAAIDAGIDPNVAINDGLIAGMSIVGERFKAGEMYVPEIMMAAKALEVGVEMLKATQNEADIVNGGKIIIGTVKGDLHDIGKNLVVMMLKSSGFDIVDLGIDVSPEKYVEAIKKEKPDIVAMSALLTTTMLSITDTIHLINEEGLVVKTIIGGAPITKDFADRIGVDGFAPNAVAAVAECRRLYQA